MAYLIYSDTYGCVESMHIIGISDNKLGVYEIIKNYYKMSESITNYTLEDDLNDINICRISLEQYNKIMDIYVYNEGNIKNYLLEQYNFENIEENFSYYFNIYLRLDGDFSTDIITKKDVKKILSIIDNSYTILI